MMVYHLAAGRLNRCEWKIYCGSVAASVYLQFLVYPVYIILKFD